ncbi:hypothetical protein CP373A1_01505 [Clostridium paraputrificum]|uniref:Uncharacterized protein n=2 Tax=Clostridiaceae TaxID=31979 RepID=A0A1B8RU10_9CLOT|nr:hypothetical protein CP373A1_01505 [Clostridium paraputrificum]
MISTQKDFKKAFKNIRENFQSGMNRSSRGWRSWPIFYFCSPFKFIILCGLLATLLLCGVGLYGLIVIILLVLLFIFVP